MEDGKVISATASLREQVRLIGMVATTSQSGNSVSLAQTTPIRAQMAGTTLYATLWSYQAG
jgi:hypothetical protein